MYIRLWNLALMWQERSSLLTRDCVQRTAISILAPDKCFFFFYEDLLFCSSNNRNSKNTRRRWFIYICQATPALVHLPSYTRESGGWSGGYRMERQ